MIEYNILDIANCWQGGGGVIASEVSTFQMIILVASLAECKGGISFDFSRIGVTFSFFSW